MRGGSSNALIACLGDSTTVGYASPASGSPEVGMKTRSYPSLLAATLAGLGVPSGSENCWCDFGVGTNAPTDDPRFSKGSWVASPGVTSFGGTVWTASGSGNGTLSFTPATPTDTCDIFYLTNSGLGSLNANVNGGANTTQGTSGAAGYGKMTVSGGLGNNVYNMTWASGGGVFLMGYNAYNSAAKQVSVVNMGQSSAPSANLAGVWTSVASEFAILAPSLAIIEIGINDWLNSLGSVQLGTNVQTLISGAKAAGSDVLLVSPVQSAPGVTPFATQQPYLDTYPPLAFANGCVMLDLNARWGGFTGGNALGYYYSDGVHPVFPGYSDQAAALAQILMM